MPFDACNGEGGGDGHTPHDPEGLDAVAKASLMQLSMNCDANGLCEFHAGLWLQGLMIQGITNTVRKHEGDDEALAMMDEQIATLKTQLATLKEERTKW